MMHSRHALVLHTRPTFDSSLRVGECLQLTSCIWVKARLLHGFSDAERSLQVTPLTLLPVRTRLAPRVEVCAPEDLQDTSLVDELPKTLRYSTNYPTALRLLNTQKHTTNHTEDTKLRYDAPQRPLQYTTNYNALKISVDYIFPAFKTSGLRNDLGCGTR